MLLAVVVVLLATGCGGSSTDTTTTSADTMTVRIYLLRDGKVWPVSREIEKPDGLLNPVLEDALVAGPTDAEKQLGLTTEVTRDPTKPSRAALAQTVYTYSQLDPNEPVNVGDKNYTRADFEDQTPLILVESPLAFDQVSSPLRVTGTANTFEATFQYELVDAEGNVVDKNFVTATSGTGTRGTVARRSKWLTGASISSCVLLMAPRACTRSRVE